MAVWTIQGETGKALDATMRSLADLDITAANVQFRSLTADNFVFTMEREAITSSANIPEDGQAITLFRNGARFFHGHVTNRRARFDQRSRSVTITVAGPWWWLERMNLTFNQSDETGITKERPVARFNSSSLSSIINTTIDRAIAMGAPLLRGSTSSMFNIPKITLQLVNFGQALAELVRLCPDAMTWFDYSTSPPTLNVTRRGDATTRTITLGTDDVNDFAVNPVLELKVEQVRLPYAVRAGNGAMVYAEQNAGTPATGKVQMVVTSGPELDTFLPIDKPESVQIRTISTGAISSAWLELVNTSNADIMRLRTAHGEKWYGGSVTGTNGYQGVFNIGGSEQVGYHASSPSSSSVPTYFKPGNRTFRDANNADLTGHLLYPQYDVPDWLVGKLSLTRCTFTYTAYVTFDWKPIDAAQPFQQGVAEWAGISSALQNYYNVWGSAYPRRSIFWKTYSMEGWISQTSFPFATTVNKAPEYDFSTPPAGFAAGLLSAQNFLPYEGRIDLTGDDVGATRFAGCAINVANSLPEHAAMRAMVEGEDLNLMAGLTSITLGSPPRIDYRNFFDKVRRTPQDNIITL